VRRFTRHHLINVVDEGATGNTIQNHQVGLLQRFIFYDAGKPIDSLLIVIKMEILLKASTVFINQQLMFFTVLIRRKCKIDLCMN
jgi:hypothetical protein